MSGSWVTYYAVAQILYFLSFAAIFYFLALPVDWVDLSKTEERTLDNQPFIVMAYPVLREDVATMTSTLMSLGWTEYPRARYRVIAIPNSDDHTTIAALRRLQLQFEFLEVVEVPPTSDPSWSVVWRAWAANPKAYWFHQGTTQGHQDLPPKKTRQLIYLLYSLVEQIGTDWVLDYIDADSMPPANHFHAAAEGLKHYDVLQATNVAGNLLDSMPASWHAFDHMCWDGLVYAHMSAHGRHPFYVLGKGLFYRARDLWQLGGFNPWITIEDPEVGMRLWANGKRLGIISDPLIEEVPRTIIRGIIQRNRWMCGFFQSLGRPLKQMGMTASQRMRARLNILPVLSLPVNVVGLSTGLYALYLYFFDGANFDFWLIALSSINIFLYFVVLAITYVNAWRRTELVLDDTRLRVWYMLRVNPVSLFIYHTLWTIPIVIGFFMFLTNRGKEWVRTQKFDADHRFAEEGEDALKGKLKGILSPEGARDALGAPSLLHKSQEVVREPHLEAMTPDP
jgi:cellulose synthase/poly-beta-1,6-N-acetylglucosamine synthase-like glycosyltransferase